MSKLIKRSYSLRLPFPPSLNRLWRTVPRRGVILSKVGRDYRRDVHSALHAQESELPIVTLTGRLAVRIEGYAPDRRKRDIDNWVKAVLDSLEATGKVFIDDGQFDRLEVIRRETNPPHGFIMVTIVALTDE
ncbi:MAG: putative crossover junction endodeoxyribonuclease [Prokaryotic dsDNA virus sp.]|nr:MAG: putative crossover junction endodeoxyribonuclease [Prokaryotic dsDNA virus sp.]|tara:strand:+ start:6057 stop:6452 length:396 start_codon:yes stop_codon:yes gene_type:complete